MDNPAWFLLNVLQGILFALWTAVCSIISFLVLLFTFSQESALAVPRLLWSPGLFRLSGLRLSIEGRDNVDFSRPHIFVLNHQSMADICVGFVSIPANLRFVAKKALAYVPFLGWYMWATGMVFVDRGNSRQAIRSLAQAGEKIRAGANIIAFPEGTRSPNGVIRPFKKGIFVVAINAGVPIVPVAVEGANKVLPPGGFRLRPASVRAKIGKPISTKGYTKANLEVLMREVRCQLIDLHHEIGGAGGDPNEAVAPRRRSLDQVPHPS